MIRNFQLYDLAGEYCQSNGAAATTAAGSCGARSCILGAQSSLNFTFTGSSVAFRGRMTGYGKPPLVVLDSETMPVKLQPSSDCGRLLNFHGLDPNVPHQITISVDERDSQSALELASAWVEITPNDAPTTATIGLVSPTSGTTSSEPPPRADTSSAPLHPGTIVAIVILTLLALGILAFAAVWFSHRYRRRPAVPDDSSFGSRPTSQIALRADEAQQDGGDEKQRVRNAMAGFHGGHRLPVPKKSGL